MNWKNGEEDAAPPKVAVTETFEVTVTWQVPVPEQPPPLHPMNPVPEALSVTTVLLSNGAEQFAVQLLMPAGLEFTVPLPETCTDRIGRLKLAVTVVSAVKLLITQGPVLVPVQPTAFPVPPLQPVKFETVFGLAVIVTAVPTL